MEFAERRGRETGGPAEHLVGRMPQESCQGLAAWQEALDNHIVRGIVLLTR
jgi:hypothetical protein